MKQSLKRSAALYGTTLGMGLAAMLLQLRAIKIGYDAKGLYVWNNPAQLGLFAVCAVFIVLLAGMTTHWSLEKRKYRELFPECWLRGGSMALAGILLILDIFYALEPMTPGIRIAGVLAAVCMIAAGIFLSTGYRPHYMMHGTVCVYFLVRLLMSYRVWGASIHLEQYVFLMLADVLIMLYSFHRCAADAGIYSCKKMVLTGCGAIFCSLAAMADFTDRVFYLAVVIWVAGSMCTLGDSRSKPE